MINYNDLMAGINSPFWEWLKGEIEQEMKQAWRELYNEGRASVSVVKVNHARARIKSLKFILDRVYLEKENLEQEEKENGKE